MKRGLPEKSRRFAPLFFDAFDMLPTTALGRIPLVWFEPLWRCKVCFIPHAGRLPPECCGKVTHRLYLDLKDLSQVTFHAAQA